jgi:hypothetical protein
MTRKTFYIILSILFLLFLIQHVLIKQPDIISKVTAAEDFSDIEIKILDSGIPETIGYYEGDKHVLLIFWTSKVDASRLALEDFEQRAEKWLSKYDLEIIAVNMGEPEDEIREVINRWDIGLTIGLDPDREIAKKFGISRIPSMALIKKNSSLGGKWDGNTSDNREDIVDLIDDEIEVHIETDASGNITKITIDGEEPDSATRDSIIKEFEDDNE